MSKALTVLAECVDIRNGKRFQPGETFNPAPTPQQAARLIKAGCLPEAALEAAVEPSTEAEQAAEKQSEQNDAERDALAAAAAGAKGKAKTSRAKTA